MITSNYQRFSTSFLEAMQAGYKGVQKQTSRFCHMVKENPKSVMGFAAAAVALSVALYFQENSSPSKIMDKEVSDFAMELSQCPSDVSRIFLGNSSLFFEGDVNFLPSSKTECINKIKPSFGNKASTYKAPAGSPVLTIAPLANNSIVIESNDTVTKLVSFDNSTQCGLNDQNKITELNATVVDREQELALVNSNVILNKNDEDTCSSDYTNNDSKAAAPEAITELELQPALSEVSATAASLAETMQDATIGNMPTGFARAQTEVDQAKQVPVERKAAGRCKELSVKERAACNKENIDSIKKLQDYLKLERLLKELSGNIS